jgi:hypothetical protein
MWTRPLVVFFLVGSVVLACGRTDLMESLGGPSGNGDAEAGAPPSSVGGEAAAADDASSAVDGSATIHAAATLDGGDRADGPTADAGATDGGLCVNVDLSTYDRSCDTASDCIYIAAGTICSGACACGNAVVNAAGQARYQQTLAPLPRGPVCHCPNEPIPQCVEGECVIPVPD